MIDDWDHKARQLGYLNECDMFTKLYLDEHRSIAMLSLLLQAGSATISSRLDKLNIPKRSRGGDNNSGWQTWKLSHFDQRIVLYLPLDQLPEMTGISRSLWYKYKRSRGGTNGLLYYLTDNGIREVQCSISPPSRLAPDHRLEVPPILPGEEGSR